MPRRMKDCGTRGAMRLPRIVPGTEPMTSGIRIRFEAVERDVGDRGGQHQRHGLHQVGADELHRRESGVEHQQGDHDDRAGADAGHTDQQAAEGADEQGQQRTDPGVGVAEGAAAAHHAQVEVEPEGVGGRRQEQREADRHLEHEVELVGVAGDRLDEVGPEQREGHRPRISHLARVKLGEPSRACTTAPPDL